MSARRGLLECLLCASAIVASFVRVSLAQEANRSETQTKITLTDLSPPVFPQLARQARIMGDVQIQLEIRKDGSVASAKVVSGHAMLKQAALESAQKSRFLCSGCSEEVNSYLFTYTFGFRNDGDCGYQRQRSLKCLNLWRCGGGRQTTQLREPVVGQSLNRVVVLADLSCVETSTAIRSGD
jgi:TonB family protein